MSNGPVILRGVVRGKTVELEHDSGLPDGQRVSVALRPALPPGEGLRRAFGAWADDSAELPEFLDQVYADRDNDSRDPAP